MKLQIQNSLKELRLDKMKNKMIDKDNRKRLLMVEDFVLNLYTRSCEVFKFCETSNLGFAYALPTITEKDQHTELYQKSLLNLEGIYQFIEFVTSKQMDIEKEGRLKEELALCRRDLATSTEQLRLALAEKDDLKKQCRNILKHTQMVHEKCKLKKLHYKELIREHDHLLAKNKSVDHQLRAYESKIAGLTENLDSSKKYIQKTQRDLNYFKDKVHKMTIEINLLEKINIEQAIDDENVKEKLNQSEDYVHRLKAHDEKLYEHLSTCNEKGNCKYASKKQDGDVAFKYEAAKNLIKRMQVTLKKKSKDLEQKTRDVADLTKKLVEANTKPCNCVSNLIIDSDGIVEENRRLWDGYFHLQLEHISIEKDMEASENKYQQVKDDLNEVKSANLRLREENTSHVSKINEYLQLIESLRNKHEKLEETLKEFSENLYKANSIKQQSDSELTHLKSFADQQQNTLRERELKFISLENEYLHAQELLEEYKISFEKIEELLDAKTAEYEEKMSTLSEELAKEKSENDLLLSILGSPLVNCVVSAYIKMEELEECIENMINLKSCQLSNETRSNNNYIQENSVIFRNGNEEKTQRICKQAQYEELKYKIRDLRNKCGESIEKIVQNANNKLGKYQMTLSDEEDSVKVETLMPSTFEPIKLQLGSIHTQLLK